MSPDRITLEVEEYAAEVLALVQPLPEADEVPLDAALGRILARDVTSRVAVPAFANSAMDGFAVRHPDLAAGGILRVVGHVPAGSAADPALGPGEAARIMTGAPVPTDADTVVPLEETTSVPGGVRIDVVPTRGRHVRAAAEDLAAGDVVLTAGTRLGPYAIAAAAATGNASLPCVRRPAVAVVATGDELVPPGGELGRGQIYESNAAFLTAALTRDGARPLPARTAVDDPEGLRTMLDELAGSADLLVLSGGVSVGDHDVVRDVLEQAGAQCRHVRMQPGKPQCWAQWTAGGRTIPVLALPGNPLSTAVSYEVFVRPVLDRLLHVTAPRPTGTAVVAEGWRSPHGRRQYLPVRLEPTADGPARVRPAHPRGSASHMVTSLVVADALAVVDAGVDVVSAGDLVTVMMVR